MLLEFRVISRFWETTTVKRMKIDPYCRRRNCSPSTFQRCIDYVDIASPPLGGIKQGCGGKSRYFEVKCVNIAKMRHIFVNTPITF